MLKIYLGNMEKAIYHPPTYFDNQYEDEWIMLYRIEENTVFIDDIFHELQDYENKMK